MENPTIAASDRNSLCQFWNDSNQNCDELTYSPSVTAASPCSICSSLKWASPVTACSESDRRNRNANARLSECSYSVSTNPPLRTGHGASSFLGESRGSRSTGSTTSGRFDSEDPI